MTTLTIVSLLTGSVAAAGKGANPAAADRLQLLAGTLLATGLLLLGACLQATLAGHA